MAQTWAPKAPTAIVERRWTVPVDYEDSLSSVSVAVSGVTLVDSDTDGDDAVVTLSAGASGTPGTVTVTATTSNGLVLVETFYQPVLSTAAALAYTGQAIASFALRKVIGISADAEASELTDALERLSDMLASWAGQGADLGIALPVTSSSVFYVSDAHASAIKNNLILQLADLYDYQPSAVVIENARRGLQQVKTAMLPSDRAGADYY